MSSNITGYVNAGYTNIGLNIDHVDNVTVENVQVSGFWGRDIALQGSTNCTVLRTEAGSLSLGYREFGSDFVTIAESSIGILEIWYANNNVIAENNITESFSITSSNSNLFFENNFMYEIDRFGLSVGGGVNFWDNGSIGNYWSDYLVRYPNATVIGSMGIGDTAYSINDNNTDNYPLMAPHEIPLSEPQPEPSSLPQTLVISASAAIVSIIGLCVLIYFRKRSR
jgi:nitrous oxidase accessory protein NosD